MNRREFFKISALFGLVAALPQEAAAKLAAIETKFETKAIEAVRVGLLVFNEHTSTFEFVGEIISMSGPSANEFARDKRFYHGLGLSHGGCGLELLGVPDNKLFHENYRNGAVGKFKLNVFDIDIELEAVVKGMSFESSTQSSMKTHIELGLVGPVTVM